MPRLRIAAAAALILLPTLLYPYGRDQAVFADVAATIRDARLPYRDIWEIKPPGIYLLYAAVAALFGPSMAAIRLVDLLQQAAAACLLYQVGRPLVGRQSAALGALWYAALYLHRGYWSTAQAESFAALPTLLVFTLCLRLRRGRGMGGPLLAGLLAGCVALLKYPLLLPLLAGRGLAIAPAAHTRGNGARCSAGQRRTGGAWSHAQRLADASVPPSTEHRAPSTRAKRAPSTFSPSTGTLHGLYGRETTPLWIGLALPLLAAWGWLVLGGAWGAYIEIQREFVAPYARSVQGDAAWWARAANGARHFVAANAFPCLLAVVGAVSLSRQRRRAAGVLGLWMALAGGAVAAQGKYFGYHWIPLLLPLALLAGRGLAMLAYLLRVGYYVLRNTPYQIRTTHYALRTAQHALRFAPVLILAWTLAVEGPAYVDGARVATGTLPPAAYLERFGRPGEGDYSFLASTWAAAHARATTRPGDGIYIWGFEPLVYLLAQRRPPTRFHFAVPLVAPWAPPTWRRELMRDLAARPPALIMVLRNDAIPWASGRSDDSAEQLHHFPELAAFLRRNYRFERRIEDFAVFRRKMVK